jgi:hypothetical protein
LRGQVLQRKFGLLAPPLDKRVPIQGFLSGWGAKWLLEKVMGKRYHANIHAAARVMS